MRIVYRVTRDRFSHDLSGEGAKLAGGRWNRKNIPMIYTSETRSLAAMEFLVHTSLIDIPTDLKIVSISIPARIGEKQVDIGSLPNYWRMTPSPFDLVDIGTKWATSGDTLLLRVPSAVMPQESNIIINPNHPDIKSVRVVAVEDFEYDSRLRLP